MGDHLRGSQDSGDLIEASVGPSRRSVPTVGTCFLYVARASTV